MRTNIARALALCVGMSWTSACGGGLDASSPIAVGAIDPTLLQAVKTFVFSFSTAKSCEDLVNLSPAELERALAAENPPLQVVVPGVDGSEHVFGKVIPNQPTAYFALASIANLSRQELAGFAALKGTVIAFGCRDLAATPGARQDLPLTLFPVGIR